MRAMTPAQIAIPFPNQPSFKDEDYLVSNCNNVIFNAIVSWPNWAYPVYRIKGPKGSGKTHLSQIWQRLSGATLIQTSQLSSHIEQIANNPNHIILENLDEAVDQNVLFHLYNLVRAENKNMLITSSSSFSDWNLSLPDLVSRLRTVPVLEISEPDDDLIRMVLMKLSSDRQIQLNLNVIEYLIPRIERSFEAIQKCVLALDEHSLREKRKITIPLAKKILDNADVG